MSTVSAGLQARLAPLALLGGLACGVGTLAVYQWVWGLALGGLVTVLTVVAAPAGWGIRLPFAVGDVVAVAAGAVPRAEGDYLIAATGPGYAVLGLTLLVVVYAVATLPRPWRRREPGDDTGDVAGDVAGDTPPPIGPATGHL